VVDLLHVSGTEDIIVVGQVKTVYFVDESRILLKVGSERFAQLEKDVDKVEDEAVGAQGLQGVELLLVEVERHSLAHPQQNSVAALFVLHQLLNHIAKA